MQTTTSTENTHSFSQNNSSFKKFNFSGDDSEIDFDNPFQILDLKKADSFNNRLQITPSFLKVSDSVNRPNSSSMNCKFLVMFGDKNNISAKKKTWISELDKLGNKKKDLLKKFTTHLESLKENESMRELSESRLA